MCFELEWKRIEWCEWEELVRDALASKTLYEDDAVSLDVYLVELKGRKRLVWVIDEDGVLYKVTLQPSDYDLVIKDLFSSVNDWRVMKEIIDNFSDFVGEVNEKYSLGL